MRVLCFFLLFFFLASAFSACHIGRMVVWNYPDFDDHRKFPSRTIHPDTSRKSSTFRFPRKQKDTASDYAPQQIEIDGQPRDFDSLLQAQNTAAFLIIKNDTLFYEKYFEGYDQGTLMNPFSVTKSLVSALVGIAIDEGHINGVGQKVSDFIPELEEKGFDEVTIEHLLDMKSGLKFTENYRAPSSVAKFYYGRNLEKFLRKLELEHPPGDTFQYQSANTQLLGEIVERATGQTLSQYLQTRLWQPMGMEHPAEWSLDREGGTEKAFCCLNARAIDWARFGRLYLNEGRWQGRQFIPQKWIERSTSITRPDQKFNYYNHWWHCVIRRPVSEAYDSTMVGMDKKLIRAKDQQGNRRKFVLSPCGDYYAEGHLGQYIYLAPEADLMILRFGENSGNFPWVPFFKSFADQIQPE